MKTKKLNKIVLGILVFILIVYIGLTLILYSFLNVSSKYINKKSLSNLIDSIDISSIIKDNADFESFRNILIDSGVSFDSFNEFIGSDSFKDFETEVTTNVIYDLLEKGNIEYRFDSNEINNLLKENIKELERSEIYNKANDRIINEVNEKLPDLVIKANGIIDSIGEKIENSDTYMNYINTVNKMMKIFDILYNNVVNRIIISVIISLIVLMAYIIKGVKCLKWIGLSFIMPAIIIYISSIMIKNVVSGEFKTIVNNITNDFNVYIFSYLIIGLTLIIINVIIFISKKIKQRSVMNVKEKK